MTEIESSSRDRLGSVIDLLNPNGYPEAGARLLRPWIEQLVGDLVGEVSLAIRFVGDRAMRRLNREYRQRDTTTDVLSFPGEISIEGAHFGDIAISVPAARRQARAAGHGIDRELRVLILHGILHCMGHDHETDRGQMARLERRLRRKWIDSDA